MGPERLTELSKLRESHGNLIGAALASWIAYFHGGEREWKKDQILNAARLLELVNTEAGGENVDGITFEVEVLKFATSFFIADTPTAREEKALRRLEVLSMPTQRRRGSMIATSFKRTGSGRHYTVGNEAARFKDSFGQKNAPIISMNAAMQVIEHKRTNVKARALFGLLDKNQNGLLELEELVGASILTRKIRNGFSRKRIAIMMEQSI